MNILNLTYLNTAARSLDFARRYHQQQAFINSDKPHELLMTALGHLRDCGTKVVLGLFDDNLTTGYGSDEAYRFLRAVGTLEDRKRPIEVSDIYKTGAVLELLCAAAEAASCSVQGFLLDLNMFEKCYSYGVFRSSRRMTENGIADALGKTFLTNEGRPIPGMTLNLRLNKVPTPCYGYQDCAVEYASGKMKLTRTNLGRFNDQNTSAWFDGRHMSSLASAFKSETLRSLVLHDCQLSPQAFISWSKTSQQTLISLHISKSHLVDEEDETLDNFEAWSRVLRYCQEWLSLDYLHVDFWYFPTDAWTAFVAKEKEDVGMMLEELISRLDNKRRDMVAYEAGLRGTRGLRVVTEELIPNFLVYPGMEATGRFAKH